MKRDQEIGLDNSPKHEQSSGRALTEIYEELGFKLLHMSEELSARDKISEADLRYEQAARAFARAMAEGGHSRRLGLGLARSRQGQRRFEDALRAYLEAVRVDPASAVDVLPRAHSCLTPALARALGTWL